MPVYQLDRREIKADARALIRSGSVSPVKFTALFFAVSLVLDVIDSGASYMIADAGGFTEFSFSFLSILIGLLRLILIAGCCCYCLGVCRREQTPYESLFDGFSFAGKVILLNLVKAVFVTLWSMLFVIPGIIASYRYSFALWNLCQDPTLGVMEALALSKRQTCGYKGQLFLLQLSFFGWLLLAVLAVGGVEYAVWGGPMLVNLETAPSLFDALWGTVAGNGFTMLVSLYLTPYIQLSTCGFYLRATALPEEPRLPECDWSSEG